MGVSPETLRAWERRYRLFDPERSEGGFRLYTPEDARRALRMKELLAAGVSAAEAARDAAAAVEAVEPARAAVSAQPAAPPPTTVLGELASRFSRSLESFDGAGAHAAFDDMLAAFDMDTVVSQVVMPYLHDLGACWARAEVTVAQEHFASRLVHGRLLALARGWEHASGPLAVVACAPGEQHDIGPIAFGLVLHRRGWRISFLGADTPVFALREIAKRLRPELVVVAATAPRRFISVRAELAALARESRLAIAGAGARPPLAREIGAVLMADGPVAEADRAVAAATA